ncbi:MAG TPA: C39 family peptidase, partial [Anaerolineae bacterium]|nr:C39 family peptidase [Anaerolineae bacterium]
MTEVHDSTLELFRGARAALGQASDLLDTGLDEIADEEPQPPTLTLYSQRDPRWRDLEYTADWTFGEAGCLVVCVAMVGSYFGIADEPPEVARRLDAAGCFCDGCLSYPDRIPYPQLAWGGRVDWRDIPADLDRLARELEDKPVIVEVEFNPGGAIPPKDQHFVVAEGFTPDGLDLLIADPRDGAATRLLERYALGHWSLERSVYGLRLLEGIA